MNNKMDFTQACFEVLSKAKLSNNTEEVARDVIMNLLTDYEDRIFKAIEYIDNCIGIEVKEELLEILKGEK